MNFRFKGIYFQFIDRLHQKIIELLISRVKKVSHNNHVMKFYIPNPVNKFRIRTFSTKEPDTLKWIESMKEGAIMWDIGANIGLYSIYAAKVKQCQVFAFEPSVFNLEFLAKNIYLNNLHEKICIFPVALSNKTGMNIFKMTHPVWGGALSTFGESYNQHGDTLEPTFEYSVTGIKADDISKFMNIPNPDYIKIDVDGIEHLILSGSSDILKTAQSILIEINDKFVEQSNSVSIIY